MTVSDRDFAGGRADGARLSGKTIAIGLFFLAIVAATTTILTIWFEAALPHRPSEALRWALLILFVLLTGWISCNFWLATLGAIQVLINRHRKRTPLTIPIGGRLALLMPIYEEDPVSVRENLTATLRSLSEQKRLAGCHLFVLSDTRSDDVGAAEEQVVRALREEFAGQFEIYYRRRKNNVGRKAGNLQDFVERWGGAYEYMLVLDADSRMDGTTVTRLADELDSDPHLALIQTWPRPVRARTLFGRLQQFAASLYGQQVAAGFGLIMGNAATYWGHNAMIRVRAFAEACGLPSLPGKQPLGGEIMSHDFVEAAFLRRRGWSVRILPERLGSFEEPPPSLISNATRDRRWCQGNLQHLQLLVADGIGFSGRLHFLMGSLAYLTSPLWLAFLLLSGALFVASRLREQGIAAWGTIPIPVENYQEPAMLVGAVLAMLFGPKLIGLLLILSDGELRRGHGGFIRVTVSALLEVVISVLTAPIMMLLHSQFVLEIFAGKTSGWRTVDRAGSGEPFSNVVKVHTLHFLFGIVATALLAYYVPVVALSVSPVLAGLLLSFPLSYAGSMPALGRITRRLGLFLIPEETKVPELLADPVLTLPRPTA